MRTRKGSTTALVLAAAGSLVLSAAMSQAADIGVGSTTIRPNEEGSVTVTLNVEVGETAVGTLTDVGFEAGASVPARAGVAAILAGDITADAVDIPVGDASDLQAFGTVQIDDEMIAYGEKRGNTLVAGGCTGGDSGTACLESSECSGGGTCEPSGRGQAGTTPAAHSVNAGIETPTTPNCTMSSDLSELMKDAVFSYLPTDCVPGDTCDTVRGIVIALDNLNTFPAGPTALFSCVIAAGETLGTFPLVCADGQVSDSPDGTGLIANGPCADGEVFVSDTAACVGDCNMGGTVTIGEVQRCVNILLETQSLEVCEACDRNGNGSVTIGEVQESVNNLLTECPQ